MEIILIGFYQPNEAFSTFIAQSQVEFHVQIRYILFLTPFIYVYIYRLNGVKCFIIWCTVRHQLV